MRVLQIAQAVYQIPDAINVWKILSEKIRIYFIDLPLTGQIHLVRLRI